MAETTSNVNNPATGQAVREVTTPASAGVQQVISHADGSTGALRTVNADGSTSVRLLDKSGSGISSSLVGTKQMLDVNVASSSSAITTTAGAITAAVANTPGTAVTASTTAQIVAAVGQAGNVTFHLVTSAFVGTLIFEASVDAGLNYAPLFAIREDGTGSETGSSISTAVAFIRQYTAALAGYAYFRVRCSSFTSGSIAVLMQPGATLIEPNPSLGASSALIGQVTIATAATAVRTSPASSATSAVILAANANRRGAIIVNDSTATLYIAYGSSGSTTDYTYRIDPGFTWICDEPMIYTGVIYGVWSAANGNARVTELTA